MINESKLMIEDKREYSPAAERNQRPIFEYLTPWLTRLTAQNEGSSHLSMLEIASGTGQHAAYISSQAPLLKIYPSDRSLDLIESVASWAKTLDVETRVAPLRLLDVTVDDQWPSEQYSIIYCANMIHISPWSVTKALFSHSVKRLPPNGVLITYGPYRFDVPLSPSNIAFDHSLKTRDQQWGIRDIHALDQLAEHVGLKRIETHPCPANNHLLVFTHI